MFDARLPVAPKITNEQGIPAPVMSLALMMRFASQGKNDYAAKMLAKMRQGFGGHAVKEG